jgi:mono/diheme cytochrome c family protein
LRRISSGLAVLALAGVIAGCGGSDPNEAKTPANAKTGANTAVQTDSKGETISTAAPGGGTEAPAGPKFKTDPKLVAAGLTVFTTNCTGCHTNNGAEAGVGPKLKGDPNITPELVATRIKLGKSPMPSFATLPAADQKAAIEFVLSLQ